MNPSPVITDAIITVSFPTIIKEGDVGELHPPTRGVWRNYVPPVRQFIPSIIFETKAKYDSKTYTFHDVDACSNKELFQNECMILLELFIDDPNFIQIDNYIVAMNYLLSPDIDTFRDQEYLISIGDTVIISKFLIQFVDEHIESFNKIQDISKSMLRMKYVSNNHYQYKSCPICSNMLVISKTECSVCNYTTAADTYVFPDYKQLKSKCSTSINNDDKHIDKNIFVDFSVFNYSGMTCINELFDICCIDDETECLKQFTAYVDRNMQAWNFRLLKYIFNRHKKYTYNYLDKDYCTSLLISLFLLIEKMNKDVFINYPQQLVLKFNDNNNYIIKTKEDILNLCWSTIRTPIVVVGERSSPKPSSREWCSSFLL